jgi:DNA gyrase subunit A
MNYLSLSGDETVTSILSMPKEMKKAEKLSLFFVTQKGVVKKVAADGFKDVRRSGLIAIKLQGGDELLAARFVEDGDELMLVSEKGQSIRFKHSDVREMGRNAGGVRGMNLKGDKLVAADVIKKSYEKPEILVVSEQGLGKMTVLKEYKVQKRGGSGIKTFKVTPKTGKLVGAMVVVDKEAELVAISKQSQVIRLSLAEVPSLGRQTQGVRIMRPRAGDSVASLVIL